jgi:glycosyltransferase involved in cell wall biosynthesis
VNGELLEFLSSLECPVITHVHELDYWIRYRVGWDNFRRVQCYTQQYVAVSRAVRENLIQKYKIPRDKVDLIYEFIPTDWYSSLEVTDEGRSIRNQMGVSDDALIVAACGTTDWRKGADLFVQVARAVHRRLPGSEALFIWVGGETGGPVFGALWHDVMKSGAEKYVRFLGHVANPLPYLATCDAFVSVSREDPFPLAVLEAACLGKPIVCFHGSGGASEFVEDDCGFVVPYQDIEAMANKVVTLLRCSPIRQRLGQRAAQKVKEHHDVGVVAPKILGVINRYL